MKGENNMPQIYLSDVISAIAETQDISTQEVSLFLNEEDNGND